MSIFLLTFIILTEKKRQFDKVVQILISLVAKYDEDFLMSLLAYCYYYYSCWELLVLMPRLFFNWVISSLSLSSLSFVYNLCTSSIKYTETHIYLEKTLIFFSFTDWLVQKLSRFQEFLLSLLDLNTLTNRVLFKKFSPWSLYFGVCSVFCSSWFSVSGFK